jgi:hypothetical protein
MASNSLMNAGSSAGLVGAFNAADRRCSAARRLIEQLEVGPGRRFLSALRRFRLWFGHLRRFFQLRREPSRMGEPVWSKN